MPAPIIAGGIIALLIKIAKILYVGKFGIYAAVKAVRNYRRKVKEHQEGLPRGWKWVGFFHSPYYALKDRAFWIRGFVHVFSMLTFAPNIFWKLWGIKCRWTQGAYMSGPCCRERERVLIGRIIAAPWSKVFSQTVRWVLAAWRSQSQCDCRGLLIIGEPRHDTEWVEVRFLGRKIMVNARRWNKERWRFALLAWVLGILKRIPRIEKFRTRLHERRLRERFVWRQGVLEVVDGIDDAIRISGTETASGRVFGGSIDRTRAMVLAEPGHLVVGGVAK